jgi:hypothetical protein
VQDADAEGEGLVWAFDQGEAKVSDVIIKAEPHEPYFIGHGNGPVYSMTFESGPNSLYFMVDRPEPFLVLHPDGRVEVADWITPDAAARQFLECLRAAFPGWVEAIRADKGESCQH